jgi:hypothetical protein
MALDYKLTNVAASTKEKEDPAAAASGKKRKVARGETDAEGRALFDEMVSFAKAPKTEAPPPPPPPPPAFAAFTDGNLDSDGDEEVMVMTSEFTDKSDIDKSDADDAMDVGASPPAAAAKKPAKKGRKKAKAKAGSDSDSDVDLSKAVKPKKKGGKKK